MIVYNFFRKTDHWTPRQVDELHLDELEWFPLQEAAQQEAQEQVQQVEEARWRQQNR